LGDYLEDAHPEFRQAVRTALLEQGFDLDETLPNLHLASHILASVSGLRHLHPGAQWTCFETALQAADRRGVLVNLGVPRRADTVR